LLEACDLDNARFGSIDKPKIEPDSANEGPFAPLAKGPFFVDRIRVRLVDVYLVGLANLALRQPEIKSDEKAIVSKRAGSQVF